MDSNECETLIAAARSAIGLSQEEVLESPDAAGRKFGERAREASGRVRQASRLSSDRREYLLVRRPSELHQLHGGSALLKKTLPASAHSIAEVPQLSIPERQEE